MVCRNPNRRRLYDGWPKVHPHNGGAHMKRNPRTCRPARVKAGLRIKPEEWPAVWGEI